MPIVAITVLEARRAAAEVARRRDAEEQAPATPAQVPDATLGAPSPRTGTPRRGHAIRDERGKWQPTGDYPTGFSRAPEEHRFPKGNKGGPGRPRSILSHDTMMRKQLSRKRPVRIDGRERNITNRELVVMTAVKSAVEGKDRDARKFVLSESARLFGGDDNNVKPGSPAELNASDALSMQEFEAEIRRQILEELRDSATDQGEQP